MPAKFVYKGPFGGSNSVGGCGIGFDTDDNQFKINPSGTAYPVAHNYVKILTASATATAEESGTTFVANSTTSIVVTLPATAAGLTYTLVVEGLTSSGGHAFSPAAADTIEGNGLTFADDKDVICTAATDRIGDSITLVGNGVAGWYITSVVGTWAAEA